MLVFGRTKNGDSANTAGLNFFADTMSVNQLFFYQRRSDKQKVSGEMRLDHLKTTVSYKAHFEQISPSLISGSSWNFNAGFHRRAKYLNGARTYDAGLPLNALLTDKLGLSLGIFASQGDNDTVAAIPTFLYLIDEATATNVGIPNSRQHLYLAGTGGLCRLAQANDPALDKPNLLNELYDRLQNKTIRARALTGNKL